MPRAVAADRNFLSTFDDEGIQKVQDFFRGKGVDITPQQVHKIHELAQNAFEKILKLPKGENGTGSMHKLSDFPTVGSDVEIYSVRYDKTPDQLECRIEVPCRVLYLIKVSILQITFFKDKNVKPTVTLEMEQRERDSQSLRVQMLISAFNHATRDMDLWMPRC